MWFMNSTSKNSCREKDKGVGDEPPHNLFIMWKPVLEVLPLLFPVLGMVWLWYLGTSFPPLFGDLCSHVTSSERPSLNTTCKIIHLLLPGHPANVTLFSFQGEICCKDKRSKQVNAFIAISTNRMLSSTRVWTFPVSFTSGSSMLTNAWDIVDTQ